MQNNPNNVPEPVNVTEQYLYGINVRLEALIHQVGTLIDAYAHVHQLASQANEVKEEIRTPKRRGGGKNEQA